MELQEWRKGRITEVTLPSGLTVKLRMVGVLDLAASGRIPAPLTGLMQEMLGAGNKGQTFEVDLAEFPEYGQLIAAVARAAVVEPPIADEPDEEHLGIGELPFADQLEIFNRANVEAQKLQPFRQPAGKPVAAAQPGQRVRRPAK